jgi:nitrite reductase (NO-forming)
MGSDRRGPFDRLRPTAIVAAGYLVLVIVWIVAGGELPGGRWLAVHLFTLGVLTNLILALSDHFARTLTRQPGEAPSVQLLVVNTGAIAVFVGVATGRPWWVAVGATAISATVVTSYRRLRRLRRTALAPRFGWIVRMYERAHGAFLHGALLGALVGTGVLDGRWVGPVRTAHLHVNVLGWAGITLLATIVFFGPTIARTRIREGADVRAAKALRLGAYGLGIGVLSLVGTGFGGGPGAVARGLAALGLAVFAWSVTVVSVPVISAGTASKAPERWSVLSVAAWFVFAAWSDVLVVGTGSWRFLEPVGAAMLLGVLAQAITVSLGFVAPRLLHLDPATAYARTEAWAAVRALAWNAGVALVVVSAAIGPASVRAWSVAGSVGWAMILVAGAARVFIVVAAAGSRVRP